jgi:hypothetical protein
MSVDIEEEESRRLAAPSAQVHHNARTDESHRRDAAGRSSSLPTQTRGFEASSRQSLGIPTEAQPSRGAGTGTRAGRVRVAVNRSKGRIGPDRESADDPRSSSSAPLHSLRRSPSHTGLYRTTPFDNLSTVCKSRVYWEFKKIRNKKDTADSGRCSFWEGSSRLDEPGAWSGQRNHARCVVLVDTPGSEKRAPSVAPGARGQSCGWTRPILYLLRT